jgi:hypothetical protein
MTQTHNLAHGNARLARVLEDINEIKAHRWDPSREELIKLRHLSRAGCTTQEAYEAMNPPIGMTRFKERAAALGVFYAPKRFQHKCVAWTGKK